MLITAEQLGKMTEERWRLDNRIKKRREIENKWNDILRYNSYHLGSIEATLFISEEDIKILRTNINEIENYLNSLGFKVLDVTEATMRDDEGYNFIVRWFD